MYFVDGLGRYELQDESSNKFWECLEDLDGTYLVRWGKIGAPKGQTQNGLSYWEASRRIEEKKRKGYIYIKGSAKSLAERERRDLEAKIPEAQKVVFIVQKPKKRL